MRFLVVALLLGLCAPAWGAAASLSAPDEARLIYLEKRVGELDAQNRELRAFAEKAAKSEADGVKDIAAAQMQGAKDGLTGQIQGLSSNFNMLATVLLAAFGALVGFNVFSYFNARREARAIAKDEAVSVAEGRMVAMEGELRSKVAKLEQGLEAKEQEILKAVQAKADALIKDMEAAKQRTDALTLDIEATRQQGEAHMEALAENRKRSDEITAELVNRQSPPVLTPEEAAEGDRLTAETRNTPPQDLTEEQLTGLTKRALARGKPADAARFAGALAGKKRKDPNALILLARLRLEQGLLDEAMDAARQAIEVAQKRGNRRAEGVVHCVLGDALWAAGRLSEAKEVFTQYRDIFTELFNGDSVGPYEQHELGVAWSRLGDVALEEGKLGEAKVAYVQYRDIFATLTAKNVEDDDWLRELGVAWSRLGEVALKQENLEEAKGAFERDRDIFATLADKDAGDDGWRRNLEAALRQCARVALAEGEVDGAEELLRRAEPIVGALLSKDPKKPLYRRDRAWLTGLWGDWHAAKGEIAEARRCWGEAVTEFGALEQAGTLDFFGRQVLKEYRAKLDAA